MTKSKKAKPVPLNTPLEYFEGQMMPYGLAGKAARACWLATQGGMIVACVSEGPDFEKCRLLLRHAAHCTQVIHDLVAACEATIEHFDEFHRGKAFVVRGEVEMAIMNAKATTPTPKGA